MGARAFTLTDASLAQVTCAPVCRWAGIVTAFCGTGHAGYADGPCSAAWFSQPTAAALVSTTLYIADNGTALLRAVDTVHGTVSLVAGSGTRGWSDGFDLAASFSSLSCLVPSSDGSVLFVCDGAGRIRTLRLSDSKWQERCGPMVLVV